jgi:hypothetical protein
LAVEVDVVAGETSSRNVPELSALFWSPK